MDEIKKNLNNISLYDVKAYVRKAQNVVLNYTEMEAKVREATNNEPWGASSTLMQKIAAGTYNYREREEIIGMIFRRFTEKAANEWRQIYKALQLLEYLIKNGSERFVDDARANLSLITMLRSFHYIDSQGRDQGINVRTKAKNLIELLNNDSTLRNERKKSRDNSKKFQGVAGGGASTIPGASYDEYGTYEGRIFGDGGVYGERYEENRSASRSDNDFEEYDAGESTTSAQKVHRSASRTAGVAAARRASKNKPTPAKPAQKEIDLFSFDEPANPTTTSSNNNDLFSSGTNGQSNTAANNANDDDDDDFGDFQGSSAQQSSQQPSLNTNTLSNLYHSQPAAAAVITVLVISHLSLQVVHNQHKSNLHLQPQTLSLQDLPNHQNKMHLALYSKQPLQKLIPANHQPQPFLQNHLTLLHPNHFLNLNNNNKQLNLNHSRTARN
ncbi:unnamed protein product [Wickerhamomyces anomalus]